jgi:hypothetical protein
MRRVSTQQGPELGEGRPRIGPGPARVVADHPSECRNHVHPLLSQRPVVVHNYTRSIYNSHNEETPLLVAHIHERLSMLCAS